MYLLIPLLLLLPASTMLAQYKMEPAGPPPTEAPAPFASLLQKEGGKIVAANGTVFCEIWFRAAAPSGPKSAEDGVSLAAMPHGAFLGILRFPGRAADRRGQTIQPGLYTLRFSFHPVNGDHLGVAPQRDFLVLTPMAEDKNPDPVAKFDDLMVMSRKASGTPHPAVLGLSPSSGTKFPDLTKEGDHDWVVHVKVGELGLALIVVGKAEG